MGVLTPSTLLWPAGRAVVAEASHRRRARGHRRVRGRLRGDRALPPGIGLDLRPAARRDLYARGGLHVPGADRPRRRNRSEAGWQALLPRARALERPAA